MRRWESQWLSIGESSGTLVAFWSNVNEKLCHVVRSRCPEKQREAEGEDAFLYWVIVNREDEDQNVERLGPVTYGKVPQGYKQVYPERGEAPQLVEGERYNIRIATNNANGVDKFFVIRNGKVEVSDYWFIGYLLAALMKVSIVFRSTVC